MGRERPSEVFDVGVQHERTAMAWERTAISMLANGVLLARYAADSAHWTIASIGFAQTVAGSGILLWAGFHYDQLHGPLREGESVVHPTSARIVGALAVLSIGAALTLAILVTLFA